MKLIEKKFLSEEEKNQILQIWNVVYPKTLFYDKLSEFDNYLNSLSEANHFIFKNDENKIISWSCKFIRDSEKWFVLILDEKIQGKGNGKKILNILKNNENNLNGWVIDKEIFRKQNNETYKSPLEFYLKNEFKVCHDIRIENEKLSAVKIIWKSNE